MEEKLDKTTAKDYWEEMSDRAEKRLRLFYASSLFFIVATAIGNSYLFFIALLSMGWRFYKMFK